MSTNDKELFQQAMHKVQRLTEYDRIPPYKPKPPKTKPNQQTTVTPDNQQPSSIRLLSLNHNELPSTVQANDDLQFSRPGIQKRLLHRLKKAKCDERTELDLHGFTVDEAYPELVKFLTNAQEQGRYTVRIIHGKGRHTNTPILKNKINYWLRQFDNVLAFRSSCQQDGGSGAVNVLLRKSKRN